jgi:hypothetical protein
MNDLAELRERVERSLPLDLARELREAGIALTLAPSTAAPLVPPGEPMAGAGLVRLDPALAEEEILELEAMASFGPHATGVSHAIFISPDVTGRHGPWIKVAIDPPLTFNVRTKTASISVPDGEHVAGESVPSALHKQLRQFVELNRDVLLAYWRQKIDTAELTGRLRSI